MRNLFDNLISITGLLIMIFVCSVFALSEIQLMTARHLHTSIINQVQRSYYAVSTAEINRAVQEKFPEWSVETQTLNSVADRQDKLVKLHYTVKIPLFNITKNGEISGFAR